MDYVKSCSEFIGQYSKPARNKKKKIVLTKEKKS